jgi:hypothetical protein
MSWKAKVYFGERFTDNKPKPVAVTWPELVEKIRAGTETTTKDGPYFMACTLTDGRRRKKSIGEVNLVALDIEKQPIPDVDALLRKLGAKAFAYSTYRHGVRGNSGADWKPGFPRLRVVVPLSQPLEPGTYKRLLFWFEEYLGIEIDSTHLSVAQLFCTCRARHPDAEVEPWVKVIESGNLFDPLNLPDGSSVVDYSPPQESKSTTRAQRKAMRKLPKRDRQTRRPSRTPRRPRLTLYGFDRVRDALRAIPACSYKTWITVGMALHDYFKGDTMGLVLYRWWSARCSEKYDPRECAAKWASFGAGKSGGITVATVFYLAKENQWVNGAFPEYKCTFKRGSTQEAVDKLIEFFAEQNKTIHKNFGDLQLVDEATGEVEPFTDVQLNKLIHGFDGCWIERPNKRPRRMKVSDRFVSNTIRSLRRRLDDPRDAVEPRTLTEDDKRVSRFLDAATTPANGSYVGQLHERFISWCEQHGHEPFSIQTFGDCLSRLGIQRKRDKGGYFCGLKVNDQ